METEIPQDWLVPVLRILRDGRFEKEILVPTRVWNDWEADSLGAFLYDVREPLIAALSAPNVIGKLIANQPEPGVTYAFWFFYRAADTTRKFYGKICLYDNKIKIKLLSAHLPNFSSERL
ncbi:MAG TPA: hypothetical protein VH280_02655 [Verrucomicrobiae bacterium]|jgi:hypothetical protein|nr:hypothetical protein [Verrucomicrobiae bacterium]